MCGKYLGCEENHGIISCTRQRCGKSTTHSMLLMLINTLYRQNIFHLQTQSYVNQAQRLELNMPRISVGSRHLSLLGLTKRGCKPHLLTSTNGCLQVLTLSHWKWTSVNTIMKMNMPILWTHLIPFPWVKTRMMG